MQETTEVVRPDYASADPTQRTRRPRMLPGVIILAVMLLIMKVPGWIWPGEFNHFLGMMWGPIIGLVATLIWWLGFSRLPWPTKLTPVAAMIVGAFIAYGLGSHSMQMGFLLFAMPIAIVVWIVWTLIALRFAPSRLRMGLVVGIIGIWAFFTTLRLDGLTGSLDSAVSFRWTQTQEEKYLASLKSRPHKAATSTAPAKLELTSTDWPGFRGSERDGRVAGVQIDTDWAKNPPKQLWKHPIGPGWSSFCVVGDRVFTQEQRGEAEVVVCLSLQTGDEYWTHQDKLRFEESMAGPGPRATPTFFDGRLYVLGATGVLNCLDPVSGSVIWSRDVAKETGAERPMWGFSSSPLISHGSVVVLTGAAGKSLAAYDITTGAPTWSVGDGWSYCSPQLSKVAGVEQILYITNDGATGVDPTTTKILWQHSFPLPNGMNRAVQPTVVDGTDILIGAAFGVGTRRVNVSHNNGSWQTKPVWEAKSIKPYYNDMVLHKGFLYGFDGAAFACVDVATGQRKWRENGYGSGQVLLLPDQDLLLILSETGFVALLDAKPDAAHEIARFDALEGKTWNHPVIASGKLVVRNGQEIAAFELQAKK